MTSIDRPDPAILGHVLAEHRELFTLMQAVRTTLAAAGPTTAERRGKLVVSVKQLREHLRTHFAQEEKGGFLEESLSRVPRLSGTVQSILEQHPALLAELDGLIRDLEAASDAAAAWSRAGAAFEAFSAHMAAHERLENAVVQEGYNEDLGLLE